MDEDLRARLLSMRDHEKILKGLAVSMETVCADPEKMVTFAFMLRGMNADLASMAAAAYRIGKIFEEMNEMADELMKEPNG